MAQKALTVSIIIPVYNEESYIARCLEAIQQQTVPPHEVIVVDNNSTDQTVSVVKKFTFVTLIKEVQQGRAAARTAGFNRASGDILARIDADSRIAQDWVARLQTTLADTTVAGVTGLGMNNLIPWVRSVHSTFWSRVYFSSVQAFFGVVTMWGANMAIRRSSWQDAKTEVCLDDTRVHEDQDLSLIMVSHGEHLVRDNHLRFYTDGQNYFYWPKFSEYVLRTIQTKRYHHRRLAAAQKISWWWRLPVGAASVALTIIFGSASLLCWPVNAAVFNLSARAKNQDPATLHRLK